MCDRWAEAMNSARLRGLFDRNRRRLDRSHRLAPNHPADGFFRNVESVDRIIDAISHRLNLEWQSHAQAFLHKR